MEKKVWRAWFLDQQRFRHGININCTEDQALDFTRWLGIVGCVVESCLPADNTI